MIQIKRVVEESSPNDRMYYTRRRLCNHIERAMTGQADETSSIMDALLSIPGVMMAGLHPYCVIITRNPMFEWAEIEAPLLKLLASFSIESIMFADGSSEPINQ